MNTTSEILKACAPQYLTLLELYDKWQSPKGVKAGEYKTLRDLMDTQTRPLLDAYAQALVRVEKMKKVLSFYADGEDVILVSAIDDKLYESNLDDPEADDHNVLGTLAKALLKELGEG